MQYVKKTERYSRYGALWRKKQEGFLMAAPFTGGCACGAVRYTCSAEPLMMANCHCRDCQRAGGAPYAAVLLVPKAAVTFTGEIKFHQVQADSGNMASRGFCPACGSPLFG